MRTTTWRNLRWTLLAASVLLFGIWLLSGFGQTVWTTPDGGSTIWLKTGGVGLELAPPGRSSPGLSRKSFGTSLPTFHFMRPFFYTSPHFSGWTPIWPVPLLVAVPTAYLWRRDLMASRRARAGACPSCGYNRLGLVPSAPCPECNAAVSPRT